MCENGENGENSESGENGKYGEEMGKKKGKDEEEKW
jgi:hypothetical protein